MAERPPEVSPELASFWGGYALQFKVLDHEQYARFAENLTELRRRALAVGPRGRGHFEIDISKFEYCAHAHAHEIEKYTVFVYSPLRLVAEKLRAICQQMPEYTAQVRKPHSVPRARDFLDIYDAVRLLDVNLATDESRRELTIVFQRKRVPLELLRQIDRDRELHRGDWPAVIATVRPGVKLHEFDFYVDFVIEQARKLEPLGDV